MSCWIKVHTRYGQRLVNMDVAQAYYDQEDGKWNCVIEGVSDRPLHCRETESEITRLIVGKGSMLKRQIERQL